MEKGGKGVKGEKEREEGASSREKEEMMEANIGGSRGKKCRTKKVEAMVRLLQGLVCEEMEEKKSEGRKKIKHMGGTHKRKAVQNRKP